MDSNKNGTLRQEGLAQTFANETLPRRVVKKQDLKEAIDAIHASPWAKEIIRTMGSKRESEHITPDVC